MIWGSETLPKPKVYLAFLEPTDVQAIKGISPIQGDVKIRVSRMLEIRGRSLQYGNKIQRNLRARS